MHIHELNRKGLVLLGCGKMGSAMLSGWLKNGLKPESVSVYEPHPSDWLLGHGVNLNPDINEIEPALCLVAVKPQTMSEALGSVTSLGGGSVVFLSIAAGIRIAFFEKALGNGTPIIRAMPNTPAAIGKGITALIGNRRASENQLEAAEALLSVVGETVRLSDEAQIDTVTAVSGSGPAYVFHLIEALAEAAENEGLPPEMALRLSRATVFGAGSLAMESGEEPAQLRINVTSLGGTTAAALQHLMDEETGFRALLRRAVSAAAARGRELGA